MKTTTWLSRLLSLCAISVLGSTISFASADEEITAIILPEQGEITVGDVTQLALQVDHPAGYQTLPVQPGHNWGDFEVRAVSPVEVTGNDDGTETSRQTIDVTLWAPGEFRTPPLTISVSDPRGELHQIEVEPVSVLVSSVLVEGDDQLRDIKPQASLPLPTIWPWILAGLILAILAGRLLLRWWRKRLAARDEVLTEAPDLRPAYQIALDELAQIERRNLPIEGRFKEHYTLVADVLRQYLEAGHQVPAMDRTTAEIRRALNRLSLPAAQKSALADLLGDADLVKFAKVLPDLDRAQHFPERARQFVMMTWQEPTPPPKNGDSGERVKMIA